MTDEQFTREFERLAHAVQTGVLHSLPPAHEMAYAACEEAALAEASHKHLRTGVNLALCEMGSLAGLLVRKGLITQDEYREAVLQGLREEVARYEARLSEARGVPVTLG